MNSFNYKYAYFRSFQIIFILLILAINGFAQNESLTFYKDIAPIIHQNCTPCHQPGKSAPFSLITYEDVSNKGEFIAKVTQSGYMPPWKADTSFQRYLNERTLSQNQIGKIKNWVASGMPKGEKKKNELSIQSKALPKPDLLLKMQNLYQIPGNNKDDFRFFHIPTQLKQDVYLQAIEFNPGNAPLVHHSRVMTDTTNLIRGIEGLSESDPKVKEFQKIPLVDEFLYGWVPGNDVFFFPEGMGKKINKNTDLILNMHYAPSPVPEKDQSVIKLYFHKSPVKREVFTLTLKEDQITNQPFLLAAGSKPTFYMSYGPISRDISLIAILPHMHVLGKSFRAFAVSPEGEAIPLIRINDWDFNWQLTYQFKTMLHLPKGSVIVAEASYDNSAQNPLNPNDPPKDVSYGWNTTDEMMNLILYYVDYEIGDEKISLKK